MMISTRNCLRYGLALLLAGAASIAVSAPPGAARAVVGKPTGPIEIRHALAGTPALGRPLEIALEIESAVPLDDVVVSLSGEDGLFVGASEATLRVPRIEAGEIYRAVVTVTPLVLDVLYLTVAVDGDAGGELQARVVLIPVRLAAQKSRSPATLKADAAGDGVVHSLPAIEPPRGRLR
jgi:hypothetical protein